MSSRPTPATADSAFGTTAVTSSVAPSSRPYRPTYARCGRSRSAATSSERRPVTIATMRYRSTSPASAPRAPSTGRASSGRATISARVPSKSRTMPATAARCRSASRSARLEGGVVVPQEDRDLRRGIDVGRVGLEPDHLDIVQLLEEVAGEVVRLDPVLGGVEVDRRDRVRRGRVGRVLGRDVPELLQPRLRVAGEAADTGTVEHGDPDADDGRTPLRVRSTGGRLAGRPGGVRAGGPADRAARQRRDGRAATILAAVAGGQRGEGLIDHDDAPDDQGDDDREAERAGGQGEVEAPVGRWLVHAILPPVTGEAQAVARVACGGATRGACATVAPASGRIAAPREHRSRASGAADTSSTRSRNPRGSGAPSDRLPATTIARSPGPRGCVRRGRVRDRAVGLPRRRGYPALPTLQAPGEGGPEGQTESARTCRTATVSAARSLASSSAIPRMNRPSRVIDSSRCARNAAKACSTGTSTSLSPRTFSATCLRVSRRSSSRAWSAHRCHRVVVETSDRREPSQSR